MFDIPELYNSAKDPDSGNNRDNNLSNLQLQFKENHFLSDTNAFHYLTQATELTMFEWNRPMVDTVPYTDNGDIGHQISMEMNADFEAAFGTFGNEGGA